MSNKFSITITYILFDILAFVGAFYVSAVAAPYIASLMVSDVPPVYDNSHTRSFSLLALIAIFIFHHRNHYSNQMPWWNQFSNILVVLFCGLLADGFLHFSTKDFSSRIVLYSSWIYGMIFILLARYIVRLFFIRMGQWNIPTIIIGNLDSVKDILFALSSDCYTGYIPKSILLRDKIDDVSKIDRSDFPPIYRDIDIHIGNQHDDFIRQHSDHKYIIVPDAFRGELRNKIRRLFAELDIQYIMSPAADGFDLYNTDRQYFFGHDIMLLHRNKGISSPISRILKRIFDVIASVVILIFGFIPMILIVFSIRKDGGSVFYSDMRVGKNGKLFRCWKFRSMHDNASERLNNLLEEDAQAKLEYEKYCKLKNDPRVTQIGKFIRKTSLDEIPQIYNVIRGDMSLVGPRPMFEHEIKKYGTAYHLYKRVKPGVTGLWQVSGRSEASFEKRACFDGWYIRNWSLWHDVIILLKTIKAVFKGSGAY